VLVIPLRLNYISMNNLRWMIQNGTVGPPQSSPRLPGERRCGPGNVPPDASTLDGGRCDLLGSLPAPPLL
jgi:hypothetical protein